MNLPDIDQLGKVIDLCRKKHVKAITIGELKLELGEIPEKKRREKRSQNPEAQNDPIDPLNPYANFPDGTLTPDQLIFYSAGGLPENDPALRAES